MDTFTVSDRPTFDPLSPDSEQEFLAKQAEYEAAYRRTGEALVLFDAIAHAWWSRQTVPGWLVMAFGEALLRHRTDCEAERYEERMRHVIRYLRVRDLRRNHTKDEALDLAVESLRGGLAGAAHMTIEGSYDDKVRFDWTAVLLQCGLAGASRSTIEGSYNRVRRDLDRKGIESEFYYLVDKYDIGPKSTKSAPRTKAH